MMKDVMKSLSIAKFIASYGLLKGILLIAASTLMLYLGTGPLSFLDGPKGLAAIGFLFFGIGAIVCIISVLRWIVLQLSWSEKVWGYTCSEAHDALRRMND